MMTKAGNGTVYREFIPSHGNFWEKGLDGTKAKKVNIKTPSPTLPAYPLLTQLAPPGALTKIQGMECPGLTLSA
jgi:hypothetical protein